MNDHMGIMLYIQYIEDYHRELGNMFLTNQSEGTTFPVLSTAQLAVGHLQNK